VIDEHSFYGPLPDPAADAGHSDHPPRVGFFTDTSVCIGCKACEVACKEWNNVPEDGLNLLGMSFDNTGMLGANSWRHVAFIEQDRRLGVQDAGLAGLPTGPPASDQDAAVVAELPKLGQVVDVLRHPISRGDRFARRVFAQFTDGAQLDLAVVAEAEIRRGDAAPDFLALYQADGALTPEVLAAGQENRSALVATSEQIREWTFLGWCALIDLAKYLRRGSLWEAQARLQEARDHLWALWAAATGAIYPWHGLSQVLDQDPDQLPPGIEATAVRCLWPSTTNSGQIRSSVVNTFSRTSRRAHSALRLRRGRTTRSSGAAGAVLARAGSRISIGRPNLIAMDEVSPGQLGWRQAGQMQLVAGKPASFDLL